MASFRSFISKSSSPSTNPSPTVPSALITTGITVSFVLHRFLILWQGPGTILLFEVFQVMSQDDKVHNLSSSLFYYYYLFIYFFFCLSLGLVVWLRLGEPHVSLLLWEIFTPALADGLYWRLSDRKSSQVTRTFLSILIDLSNMVDCIVSARPSILTPLIFLLRLRRLFQVQQLKSCIIVTLIFHCKM